jgi:ribosomal protein L30/L7E
MRAFLGIILKCLIMKNRDHAADALAYLLGLRSTHTTYVCNETYTYVYVLSKPVFSKIRVCLN